MGIDDPRQWRAVPLDVLREYAREQAECSSLRNAADFMGVGRSTLSKFIAGDTAPHPRVRRAVALHYLGDRRLEAIRAAIQLRASLTSMRVVADEVGVSHGTIFNFLNGALPQPRIFRALEEWTNKVDEEGPPDVQGALWVLLAALPEAERPQHERSVLEALAGVYRRAGVEPPPWTRPDTSE